MKKFESIDPLLGQAPEVEPIGTHAFLPAEFKAAANQVIKELLEDGPLTRMPLLEATVHRSRGSRIFVATFTGPQGGQVWRTTGSTDYELAMKKAKTWEARARRQRTSLGRTATQPRTRVSRPATAGGRGPLTQQQVARVLRMSVRAVRETERRAFWKLRNHPELKQLWQRYVYGDLDEACWVLTPTEIEALFDVARTSDELLLIEKILGIIQ